MKTPSLQLTVIVEEYRQHLLHCQSLTQGTICWHTRQVRRFLKITFGKRAIKLHRLHAVDLYNYISESGTRFQPKTITGMASSLRSFFRFAKMRGYCPTSLAEAVPTASFHRATKAPKFLTEKQLSAFLATLRSGGLGGLRNRAIILCLARLGLRAGEVAGMKLEDVDWRGCTLRLGAAKGRRHQIQPLEDEVRQALVDYLTGERPETKLRQVFLSIRLAGRPLASAAVSRVAARALKRAGVDAPFHGAHLFRHTVAVHLVQRGATIKEVADFLRHRSLDTTVVYAKADFPLLQTAVQLWLEVQS